MIMMVTMTASMPSPKIQQSGKIQTRGYPQEEQHPEEDHRILPRFLWDNVPWDASQSFHDAHSLFRGV